MNTDSTPLAIITGQRDAETRSREYSPAMSALFDAVPGAPPVGHEPGAVPSVRQATTADAPAIHQLIVDNLQVGHLLPRSLVDVTARASRFVVVVGSDDAVLACAELAPLNASVAEVRSLVVREGARGQGIGHVIVDELRRRARAGRYRTLCAFTHDPRFFVRFGFSIVPHTWLPEKVAADCWSCPHFQKCGQYAVVDTKLGRPVVPSPTQELVS